MVMRFALREPAHQADDFAQDNGIRCIDRLHGVILRLQAYASLLLVERLDGR